MRCTANELGLARRIRLHSFSFGGIELRISTVMCLWHNAFGALAHSLTKQYTRYETSPFSRRR